MNFTNEIKHMNDNHVDVLISYVKYYTNRHNFGKVVLKDILTNKIILVLDDKEEVEIFTKENINRANVVKVLIDMAHECKTSPMGLENNEDQIKHTIVGLIDSLKTVSLATVGKDNIPTISYAPFICYHNTYYIYISKIADHYQNIKENNNLQIMFIEDERLSKVIIARRRAIFTCTAEFLDNNSKEFDIIIDSFAKKVDKHIKLTKQFQDFILIKLRFHAGKYIHGIGKAYNIDIINTHFYEGNFTVDPITTNRHTYRK